MSMVWHYDYEGDDGDMWATYHLFEILMKLDTAVYDVRVKRNWMMDCTLSVEYKSK